MTKLSVLDLAPIKQGSTAGDALGESLALAQRAEQLGYHRFWLAEHHNMPGIASAATAVVIGHVAGGTKTIRVGAGGIMLPNHAPLMVAEAFGTLATLYPGRIDLGLGRAPGTDPRTMAALRRDTRGPVDSFPQDVQELIAYLDRGIGGLHAVPGEGTQVPVWILGSSHFGAQLAAALGLPYAFASHFAPDDLEIALDLYRRNFQPSPQLDKPHVMLGLSLCAADSDGEAERLFTSQQQAIVNLRSGRPGQLPPPVADYAETLEPRQADTLAHVSRLAIVGGPQTVTSGLDSFIARHQPDEIMVSSMIFDAAARQRSYEILATVHPPQG